MKKRTNVQIKAALKPFCWHMNINSSFISIQCNSEALRTNAAEWIMENLNLQPSQTHYANKSFSAHFQRSK